MKDVYKKGDEYVLYRNLGCGHEILVRGKETTNLEDSYSLAVEKHRAECTKYDPTR